MTITRAQRDALIRVRDRGPEAWAYGVKSRAGGATSRMFDRLVELGLVSKPPYEVTEAGHAALKWDFVATK